MVDRSKNIIVGLGVLLVLIVAGVGGLFFRISQMRREASLAVAAVPMSTAGNLRIGDRMPDFTLMDGMGKMHSVHELLDGKHFVVITFHHPDCPCAASCGKLISAMGSDGYEDVRVLGILATDWDGQRVLDAIDKQRAEKIVTFPIVYDTNGEVRKRLGATRTPEIWLLAKDGTIAYYGAPENTLFPETPGHRNLLKEAVDALRAGRKPSPDHFAPFGCMID